MSPDPGRGEDAEPVRGLLQGDHTPGEYDPQAVRSTGIRLDAAGACPRCRRPLTGLAYGGCTYCEARGPWYQELPAVAERLHAIAPGWTPARLQRWAAPRPAHFAWALAHRRWETLDTWVAEGFRGEVARLEMNLRGRGCQHLVEDVEVAEIRLEAIHDFDPWLTLRIEGRRSAFRVSPDGTAEEGDPAPTPFLELWRLHPTGAEERPSETLCHACGGPGGLRDLRCRFCGCAVLRRPGPWLLAGMLTAKEHSGAQGAAAWTAGGLPPNLPRTR